MSRPVIQPFGTRPSIWPERKFAGTFTGTKAEAIDHYANDDVFLVQGPSYANSEVSEFGVYAMPKDTRTIQCPLIHLNGTSADRLIEDLEAAYTAVDAALDSLRKIGPNGRDYYPLGPDAMEAATTQHRARAMKIQNVKDELEAIINAIEAKETTATVVVRS